MNKLPIAEKAYNVWHVGMLSDNPHEGYSMSDLNVYYAETPSKAKTQCTLVWDYHIDGEEPKFTDIKVRRCKSADKVIFEGETITRSGIDRLIERRNRDSAVDKLLLDNPNSKAYILKGGLYYRPNSSGYTEFKQFAGVYDLEYAVSSVKSTSLSDYMRPIVIDVEEHNSMINKTITDLKTRLVQ